MKKVMSLPTIIDLAKYKVYRLLAVHKSFMNVVLVSALVLASVVGCSAFSFLVYQSHPDSLIVYGEQSPDPKPNAIRIINAIPGDAATEPTTLFELKQHNSRVGTASMFPGQASPSFAIQSEAPIQLTVRAQDGYINNTLRFTSISDVSLDIVVSIGSDESYLFSDYDVVPFGCIGHEDHTSDAAPSSSFYRAFLSFISVAYWLSC
jgi:hypothetical protein